MTRNQFGEIVLSRDEYEILKGVLEAQGVNLIWSVANGSVANGKEYTCYVRNPWKEAGGLWGDDHVVKNAKEFFERYRR